MPEIEHNGPGFRYVVVIRNDKDEFTEVYDDWTRNRMEKFMGTVNEPYEITVQAVNDIGPSLIPAVKYLGYTGGLGM